MTEHGDSVLHNAGAGGSDFSIVSVTEIVEASGGPAAGVHVSGVPAAAFVYFVDDRGVGHSSYLLELEMLAAQVNARRRPRDGTKRPARIPRPQRVSLLTWLLWDAVLLAYGLAALILLRVVKP